MNAVDSADRVVTCKPARMLSAPGSRAAVSTTRLTLMTAVVAGMVGCSGDRPVDGAVAEPAGSAPVIELPAESLTAARRLCAEMDVALPEIESQARTAATADAAGAAHPGADAATEAFRRHFLAWTRSEPDAVGSLLTLQVPDQTDAAVNRICPASRQRVLDLTQTRGFLGEDDRLWTLISTTLGI